MLVGIEMQVALALGFARAKEAVGRGELGHDQPASGLFMCCWGAALAGGRHDCFGLFDEAGIADEATEDSIGYASHWREDGGWFDADRADLKRLRYLDLSALRRDGDVQRSFPEFMHEKQPLAIGS